MEAIKQLLATYQDLAAELQTVSAVPPDRLNMKIVGFRKVDPNEVSPDGKDPNFAGLIRKIPGARLLYKRETEAGTFEELWIYKIANNIKDDAKIRRAILAGTDIEQGRVTSEDGSQQYDVWTAGDRQFLHITGLPS